MVIALLASLLLTCLIGLRLYGLEGHGPLAVTALAAHQQEAQEAVFEFWEEFHESFANLPPLLVFLHMSGVLLSARKQRIKLVKVMFTGYKEPRARQQRRIKKVPGMRHKH